MFSGQAEDIGFSDATTGWIVGAGGTIAFTTDGGSSWSFQTSGTSEALTGLSVLRLDPKLYWAEAAGQGVIRSDLGGNHLETIASPSNAVNGVAIDISRAHVYWLECCGNVNGRIWRSETDGANPAPVDIADDPGSRSIQSRTSSTGPRAAARRRWASTA